MKVCILSMQMVPNIDGTAILCLKKLEIIGAQVEILDINIMIKIMN